jgi:thiol-disulfide isomerase/thioredoxin
MRKIILFVCIIAYVFTACKDNNAYTLTGTFADSDQDGKVVYLQQLEFNLGARPSIDSTIVENGKFVFNGIAEEKPVVQFIVIGESIWTPFVFIAEKGKIELNFDPELKVAVKGTAMNNQYQQFVLEQTKIVEKMRSARNKFEDIKQTDNFTSGQRREFVEKFKELSEELESITFDFIKANITTPVGQYFLIDNMYSLNDNKLKELIALSASEFKQSDIVQRLETLIEVREATGVGKQFTNIKGFNLDGKEVSLSDYAGKGKVVLVDFWASWCGPCIYVMPDLVNIYRKYKNRGFEIVGVSLDSNQENWKKSTESLQITWPQFSNLQGWGEDGAVAYGINLIPNMILIDKDGKIIERQLSMETLSVRLEELLGEI